MSNLLVWKEKLQRLYAKYSFYIDKAIQFALAFLTFWFVSTKLGYMKPLAQPVIMVVLAVVCAFLPTVFTVLAAAGLTIAHLFSLSLGIAATALAIFVLMFIFYFRFAPKTGVIILLVPIAFAFKIPYVIPIVWGLIGTPTAVLPIALGVITYYMVTYVNESATVLKGLEGGMMQQITVFLQKAFSNKEMWIMIAAFGICLLAVYGIRRLAVDHAWEIAIVSGIVVNMIVIVGGEIILNINTSYVELIVGCLVAGAIGFLIEFFVFAVDYTRTERLQFEDDEFYYYVKAVPKIQIAPPEKTVKTINERQETASLGEAEGKDAVKTSRVRRKESSGKKSEGTAAASQKKGGTEKKEVSQETLTVSQAEEMLLAKSLQEELDIQNIVNESLKETK